MEREWIEGMDWFEVHYTDTETLEDYKTDIQAETAEEAQKIFEKDSKPQFKVFAVYGKQGGTMTRFEKLKNEATLEEVAEVMMNLSVRVAKDLARNDEWDLEISNFDKADIEQFFKDWLKCELKSKTEQKQKITSEKPTLQIFPIK